MELLISLLILLVVCAVVWWVLSLIPMEPNLRTLVNIVFAVIVLIVVLKKLVLF